VISDDPLGSTWRLNGRLRANGQTIGPPGRWSWLAVGCPALVGEVVRDAVFGSDDPPTDMRGDSIVLRPALAELAAAAVGLRYAGVDIPLGLLVKAYDPMVDGLPERAILNRLQGVQLTDRATGEQATSVLEIPEVGQDQEDGPAGTVPEHLSFETATAGVFEVQRPADGLPYRVVRTLDTAPQAVDRRLARSRAKAKREGDEA